MKHTLLSVAAVLALGCTSNSALAQATTVKFGWVNVQPNSTASSVTGPLTPVDALSLKVQDQSTAFFSVSRELNEQWEAELALGVPPTHDVAVVVLDATKLPPSVAAQNGVIGAKVRQVAPTIFANYKFGQRTSSVRPFIGVGVNFTSFDKADSTAANDAINGGATVLKLKDSAGLALQLGVSAKLGNGPWSLNGSWSTAQVKTKLTTNTLGVVRTADITFHPSVFCISLGYTF